MFDHFFWIVVTTAEEPESTIFGSQLDRAERKRQEYIKELISTEQAYIEDMLLVHEVISLATWRVFCSIECIKCRLLCAQVFEKPLLESMVLTVNEVDRIFVNWRDIIACNDNFLR